MHVSFVGFINLGALKYSHLWIAKSNIVFCYTIIPMASVFCFFCVPSATKDSPKV
jgi:hypothetical protein